jgi:DNA-binding NarL/FixJ family response regulator
VADDHPLMLAALRRVFAAHADLEIVAEVTRGSQVLPAIASSHPDILLLDVRMPELDGIGCLQRLRRRGCDLPVVVLTSYSDEAHLQAARAAGASAYVVKTVDPTELADIVRAAAAGAEFRAVVPDAAPANGGSTLSDREASVLHALADGLSNKEIGRNLHLSEQTVKFHLRNIYRKLDVASRTEAVRWAYRHGLASPSRAAAGH